MKIPETYKCEMCEKRRNDDSNHWLHGHLVGTGIMLLAWCDVIRSDQMERSHQNADAHLCGQDHAIQWVSKELSKPKEQ